jgi:hypothetical protein
MTAFEEPIQLTQYLRQVLTQQLENETDYFLMEHQHNYFINTLCDNFEDIFKLPITAKLLEDVRSSNLSIEYYEDPNTKWNYALSMMSEEYNFCCNDYDNVRNIICYYAVEEDELFNNYQGIYVYGFLKPEYRNIHSREIEYPEPDLECDEDIPLYDVDECPCCMEKFGITEKQELIGNHPTKKILKKTKTFCIKRNTYCGHPLCLDCFKTICKSGNTKCPMCRQDYNDTGDVAITDRAEEITEQVVRDMMANNDDMLFDMVNIPAIINQQIISDGLASVLGINSISSYSNDTNETYYFGLE